MVMNMRGRCGVLLTIVWRVRRGNDWPPQLEPRLRRLNRHTTLPAGGAVLPGPGGTVRGETGPGGWAEYGGRTVRP